MNFDALDFRRSSSRHRAAPQSLPTDDGSPVGSTPTPWASAPAGGSTSRKRGTPSQIDGDEQASAKAKPRAAAVSRGTAARGAALASAPAENASGRANALRGDGAGDDIADAVTDERGGSGSDSTGSDFMQDVDRGFRDGESDANAGALSRDARLSGGDGRVSGGAAIAADASTNVRVDVTSTGADAGRAVVAAVPGVGSVGGPPAVVVRPLAATAAVSVSPPTAASASAAAFAGYGTATGATGGVGSAVQRAGAPYQVGVAQPRSFGGTIVHAASLRTSPVAAAVSADEPPEVVTPQEGEGELEVPPVLRTPEEQVRAMWEVPSLAMAFISLKTTLRLKRFTITEFEYGLINPTESRCVGELITKLLEPSNKDLERIRAEGYHSAFWNVLLKDRLAAWYERWTELRKRVMASKGQQYVEPSSDDETLVASTTTVSGGASLAKATVAAGVVAADAVTTTAASQQPQQQRRAGDDGDGDDGENAGDTKTTAAAENGNDDDLPEVSEQEVSEENLWRTLLDELPTKNPLRRKTFAELPLRTRVLVLKALLESRLVDDDALGIALRTLPPEEIRMDPVGRDSIGNEYYFFPQFANDARVYRWNRRKDIFCVEVDTVEAFQQFLERMLAKAKLRRAQSPERAVYEVLKDVFVKFMAEREKYEREREREAKRLEMMAQPRRLSTRMQDGEGRRFDDLDAYIGGDDDLRREAHLRREEELARRAKELEDRLRQERWRQQEESSRQQAEQRRMEQKEVELREKEARERREKDRQRRRASRELHAKLYAERVLLGNLKKKQEVDELARSRAIRMARRKGFCVDAPAVNSKGQTMYCICYRPDTGGYVECLAEGVGGCNGWVHPECVDFEISLDTADDNDGYICTKCRKVFALARDEARIEDCADVALAIAQVRSGVFDGYVDVGKPLTGEDGMPPMDYGARASFSSWKRWHQPRVLRANPVAAATDGNGSADDDGDGGDGDGDGDGDGPRRIQRLSASGVEADFGDDAGDAEVEDDADVGGDDDDDGEEALEDDDDDDDEDVLHRSRSRRRGRQRKPAATRSRQPPKRQRTAAVAAAAVSRERPSQQQQHRQQQPQKQQQRQQHQPAVVPPSTFHDGVPSMSASPHGWPVLGGMGPMGNGAMMHLPAGMFQARMPQQMPQYVYPGMQSPMMWLPMPMGGNGAAGRPAMPMSMAMPMPMSYAMYAHSQPTMLSQDDLHGDSGLDHFGGGVGAGGGGAAAASRDKLSEAALPPFMRKLSTSSGDAADDDTGALGVGATNSTDVVTPTEWLSDA